ncbi:MAG: homocysteine S-methyltransferase family protein [Actinomycetota bacterium]|nr:homocysteine S-methyltransferase family protein [Actinomycetota bacterium]
MAHRDPHPFGDGSLWLTDAGAETALIFHQGVDLPGFATFPLLESETGRAALREYIEPFLGLARERHAGFVLGTSTWRANPDWGAELGYDEAALAAVNRRAVEFAEELRAATPAWDRPVLIEGVLGPRGDAYAPSSLMTAAEAERYHSSQLQTLGDSATDVACALTITYADEAIGMVRAAEAVGLPISVSFTLETDGRLPSGQTLRAAIEQVDDETDGAPLHYMINCAHPTHFTGALSDGGPWLERLRGLRANASMLSHAELDGAEDLDDGDPADLGRRHAELRGTLPNLTLLGGCCGTDIRHVTSICDAWISA